MDELFFSTFRTFLLWAVPGIILALLLFVLIRKSLHPRRHRQEAPYPLPVKARPSRLKLILGGVFLAVGVPSLIGSVLITIPMVQQYLSNTDRSIDVFIAVFALFGVVMTATALALCAGGLWLIRRYRKEMSAA
ncbi:hypothetical protein [Magnetospirillum gryphiswaldense]|uniref:Membrane protein n=1 Tax=Magnetospirillum gryphiswaldense TaxID=55518 RepID=A4TZW3_9PROT|nr:hypothetical protein [Magnetospirillum gryphiswaldense]AVM74371.1 hypothetical protein MSR1_18820 [Magnetospirillum gryphiswaldense MSR-1]AVM78274.1 hypothetical protein MSR1L_18820 [Magnetospirillum gryphiswaldense]CAM76170.1 membrane protein [Magnetospirillum gryphiswaldense MSR-1]